MTREEQERLRYGAAFGFLQSMMQAFAMIVPTLYFSSLSVSIVVYALLQSIADIFSFIAKPAVGHFTDAYGERAFLLGTMAVFVLSLFLIGQTASVPEITVLKVISGVAASLLFIVIIIYSLRLVKKQPDQKVGLFNAVKSSGWVLGLLIPSIVIDRMGISAGFNLILIAGIVWFAFMYRMTKKYQFKPMMIKPSLSFVRKVPLPLVYKTMDLAVFSVFLFYFTRYGLQTLGLTRSVVTSVIIIEILSFVAGNYVIGRISSPARRKYWIPAAIVLHGIAALTMVAAGNLMHYYIAGMFIGLAGGFVDVWVLSYLSETAQQFEKGKVIGTFGWSYDLATIVGAQLPVLFVLLNQNIFASMFVFPLVMAAAYGAAYVISRKAAPGQE